VKSWAVAIAPSTRSETPAHHLPGDRNPITGFHHLVMLSQIAHRFRDWDVVRYVPPPPDFSTIKIDTLTGLAPGQVVKAVAMTQQDQAAD
jgi:hypothetical protein